MVDSESFFRLWRADRRRRDAEIERKRAHFQLPGPTPASPLTLVPPPQAEPAAEQEVA